MYVGNIETKQLISIALMILFAMAAVFFLGYKLAYNKAITYANEQIEEKTAEFRINSGLVSGNPDFMLGNLPDFGDLENEK